MTANKNRPHIQFRDAVVEHLLDERRQPGRSVGLIAARDLERYYTLLADSLATVALSEAEALLVCDALNGVIHEPHTYKLVWALVDDSIQHDALDRKWGVHQSDLLLKLRSLTAAQCMALIDAVDRFWLAPNEPDRLRRLGLVR